MTRESFLDEVKTEHSRWVSLIESLDERQMLTPNTIGARSVKETIVHVTWHQREMIGVLHQRALIGSDLWRLGQDERNEAIYEQSRDKPLADVLSEMNTVYVEMWEELQTITDTELDDPSLWTEWPPEWNPASLLASNMHEHERDHAKDIQAWLSTPESEKA